MTDEFAIMYSLPWATFALLFNDDGYCTEAPPVARWCLGKDQSYLGVYWTRRGAKVVVLP